DRFIRQGIETCGRPEAAAPSQKLGERRIELVAERTVEHHVKPSAGQVAQRVASIDRAAGVDKRRLNRDAAFEAGRCEEGDQILEDAIAHEKYFQRVVGT